MLALAEFAFCAASAAARFLFPRPDLVFLSSISLVGESQSRGGAQSCFVASSSVPTYVFPLHVTFTTRTPPSVSCHTMPSSVTLVPGSHGPKQSGSVMVPTLVCVAVSFISRFWDAEIDDDVEEDDLLIDLLEVTVTDGLAVVAMDDDDDEEPFVWLLLLL